MAGPITGLTLAFYKPMIRALALLFLAIFASVGAFADLDGNTYSRATADSDPVTLRARSEFDKRTKRLFRESSNRYGVREVQLKMNMRLVAQRARGAATANAVLPVELDKILHFISDARRERDGTLRELLSMRGFQKTRRADIEAALTKLAQTKMIDLEYWGYIGRTERYPKFDDQTRTLTYFAKWNERESSYVLCPERLMRFHVIKGLLDVERKSEGWFPFL